MAGLRTAGRRASQPCSNPLPPFDDMQVTMRGDTAIIEFAGVPDAVDYRVYPHAGAGRGR